MLNFLPKIMIICLSTTLIVELIFAYILKIRKTDDLLIIFLVNTLTNPLLVSITFVVLVFYGTIPYIILTIILELLAFFIEGFIYKKTLDLKKINPYLLSFILNLSSYSIGYIINYFIY